MLATRKYVLSLLLLAGFWHGCATTAPLASKDNFSYLYGKSSAQLPLQARVHHIGPDLSRVYYSLNTTDLLYKSDGTGGPFHASVRISYESYDSFGSKVLLDSASTIIDDESTEPSEEKQLIGSMDLRRNERRSFVLKLMARDLNRDAASTLYLRVERDDVDDRQYFMPVDSSHGLPLFTDHFKGGAVRIRCEVCAGDTLFVQRSAPRTSLPPPVFSTQATPEAAGPAKPDSTFSVLVDANGHFVIDLDRPGAYRINGDTARSTGYTMHAGAEAYPIVVSPADLLPPLRYITSNQEFERISRATDLRGAVEHFWIDAAGDHERGREAIRIFYGRVENANRHFTGEAEGWRTDRGLVHIIFGVPTTIYRTDQGETWIFGEENNLMSLSFNFVRRNGSANENDLVLQRDPLLKGAWYRNVESWRNGRVYQN